MSRIQSVGIAKRHAAIVVVTFLTMVAPAGAQGAASLERAANPASSTAATNARDSQKKSGEDVPKKKSEEDARKKKSEEDVPKTHFGFRWDDHPSLHLAKGTHIDFRARVQTHIRRSEASIEDADDSGRDVARRRVALEGEIASVVNFQVEREFGSEDPWRDVYANYGQFEFVQVQGGKFKLPFSMDENTSPTRLDFVNRSLAANALAPGRDRGVMAHGRLLNRVLRYEIGTFDHDGRNARTRNPERVFGDSALAGRLLVQPFRTSKSAIADLQFGIAFTTSDVPLGIHSLQGHTTMDAVFFDPDLWVQGRRRRTGLEARWRPGPFSIKSEYIRVTTERRGQSVEDTDLSPLLATGWYVSGTWALTGENKVNGLDTPRRPFLRGGFGAVELAVRVEKLAFGSTASNDVPSSSPRADVVMGNDDRATTFGVNWYLNRWIKVQVNAIRETIGDPQHGPSPGQSSFWSHLARFQFTL